MEDTVCRRTGAGGLTAIRKGNWYRYGERKREIRAREICVKKICAAANGGLALPACFNGSRMRQRERCRGGGAGTGHGWGQHGKRGREVRPCP